MLDRSGGSVVRELVFQVKALRDCVFESHVGPDFSVVIADIWGGNGTYSDFPFVIEGNFNNATS